MINTISLNRGPSGTAAALAGCAVADNNKRGNRPMPFIKQLSLLVAISILITTTAGCPTVGSSVQGQAGSAVPGELIDWPPSQVDPTGEDTAGFNQIISADMNGDGLVDLVTAAYESQPIQVHLQQRAADGTISFQSFSVAGSGPIVRVSELRVADIDQDGNQDIVVSILDNGFVVDDLCASQQGTIIILFAPPDPADNLNWEEFNLTQHFRCELVNQIPDPLPATCIDNPSLPECGSIQVAVTSSTIGFDGNERNYASMDVGDVNLDGFPDILAAFNGCDDPNKATKLVELWINPADGRTRENEIEVGDPTTEDTDRNGRDDSCTANVDSPWQRILLEQNVVDITSVRFSDIDLDGDLDVVALRPSSKTRDITWQSNPQIPVGLVGAASWGSRLPIGESDAGLDILEIGDLDGDGFNDVLALGQSDRLLRWFRRPLDPSAQTFPWDVFNMVQYTTLVPTALEIADINVDGQLDVIAAAGGHLRWFTPLGTSPFESWSEQFVATDSLIGDNSATVGSSPFFPINSVHAVDINGDGRLDITATLDRTGTDNDAIVWFQNNEIESE
jgi:hypothetical protein